MPYYDYRSYLQTIIENQGILNNKIDNMINYLCLFIFIFVCFYLYYFIRNSITRGKH